MSLIKLFKRSTNSKNFIPEIDGLRFFAIITVLIYHLNTSYTRELGLDMYAWADYIGTKSIFELGWWTIRLDLGVKVFFSLSGFILALPFINQYYFGGKKVIIKEYFYRRISRLEPPFIASLIVLYIAQIVYFRFGIIEMLPHFIAGLFYLHMIIYGYPNPINNVTWSLETEAQFYIILPLIVLMLVKFSSNKVRCLLFMGLLICSIYLRWFTITKELFFIGRSILVYFINFGTGIIFAFFYMYNTSFLKRSTHFLYDIVCVISLFGLFWFYKPQSYWLNNILFNLSVLFLFLGVFKGTIFNWLFTRKIIYLIGGMCYSIYLLHYAILFIFVKYTSTISLGFGYWVDLAIQFSILFPIVLFLSAIFYLIIEKPCMDKNWFSKMKEKYNILS